MKKVLIPTKLEALAANILTQAGYLVIQDDATDLSTQAAQHPDACALIVRSEKVSPEIIDALPHLKLVVRAGAGYDTIDIAHARKNNIDVMNTPGANANAVAEEVVAMTLAQYRHIVRGDQSTRAGQWEKKHLMGCELANKTLGIIGLGNIGRLVAKRMQGFDVKVLGYDPVLAPQKARDMGITPCSLEEIFEQADIITLHVPGGASTKHMVNKELMSSMKDGALLINCARFGIVDEESFSALKAEGKNIHYLTDVYAEDKAGEKASAAYADLMLPHLGASTIEANLTAARRAAEQMIAYFDQGITSCVVNKGTPDGLNPEYQHLAFLLASLARKSTEGKPIRQITCTFYGSLHPFSQWFLAPILAGLTPHVERGLMPADAQKALATQGIDFISREPQTEKNYGDSMTIDLITEENHEIHSISVRGVIAEGVPMVSRFSNFSGLYFDLRGNSLVVQYKDRPGVIALIAAALAENNINIDNIAAPRDKKSGDSLAVLKVNQALSPAVVETIKKQIEPKLIFALSL